ncbi:hypothetical protein EJ02DRAFT_13083 [Clathrospora elynae]|uniref:Uncharacterized protein n=1 Tax=Clathrospora elynae TaxID=706981 RepID=A0A6A5TAH2_9PLEO|nr:hypothetical protein EJ02DRAFT_13083 [Clathrospora elynae]
MLVTVSNIASSTPANLIAEYHERRPAIGGIVRAALLFRLLVYRFRRMRRCTTLLVTRATWSFIQGTTCHISALCSSTNAYGERPRISKQSIRRLFSDSTLHIRLCIRAGVKIYTTEPPASPIVILSVEFSDLSQVFKSNSTQEQGKGRST